MEYFVYRLFAKHDRLLYVGCTSNIEKRLKEHRLKPWFDSVDRVQTDAFPDRAAALDAEREAIRAECPRHNVTSMNPGAFGEGKFDKEIKVRNCTILVGLEEDTGNVRVSFIPHDGKKYDQALAIKRAVEAARVIARRNPKSTLEIDWKR